MRSSIDNTDAGSKKSLHYTRIIELKAIDILISAVNKRSNFRWQGRARVNEMKRVTTRLPRVLDDENWISLSYHLRNRFLMYFITFRLKKNISFASFMNYIAALYQTDHNNKFMHVFASLCSIPGPSCVHDKHANWTIIKPNTEGKHQFTLCSTLGLGCRCLSSRIWDLSMKGKFSIRH